MVTTIKQMDPVCGMTVEPETAAAETTVDGRDYYFCSANCQREFEKNPQRFIPTPQLQLVQLSANGVQTPPAREATNTDDGNRVIDIPILGMTCNACARHIENSLR